jgi:hypothetical protein
MEDRESLERERAAIQAELRPIRFQLDALSYVVRGE